MGRLLLHVCCAHCGAFTIDYWRALGHEVTLLWYNPNIHPFLEHQQRLESFKRLCIVKSAEAIIEPGYEIEAYFRAVSGHEGDRCGRCFTLRLGHTASLARVRGYAAFSTTLLISPHQDHALVRQTGETLATQQELEFGYADLRKRFSDSRRQTKPLELYRQQYCGCLFSEWERYR